MNAGRELAAEEIREHKATIAAMSARIATLEAELAEARNLLREALPHLHHTGATHHHQCACSVKRRIEAMTKTQKDSTP